jgi:regulator of protease activity HflC (stomatin/prohibitin superfamily)
MEILVFGIAILALFLFVSMVQIVPEAQAWIIEELGKYKKTLGSGLHIIIPILHRIAYKHTLKEQVIDVPPQVCITSDNVQVSVDGILYLKVIDPQKASYGIENYKYATIQLAQTTMRSEIGRIMLDSTFSERETINNAIVKSVDLASDPWGIKVTRYEIRDIEPAATVIEAMEQQVEAERQKRAEILQSEGDKLSRINRSKGDREEAINLSQGQKQKVINEAEGRAQSMAIIANATAEGIRIIGEAIRKPGGQKALSIHFVQKYLEELKRVLSNSQISILPPEAAQLQGLAQILSLNSGNKSKNQGAQ